jgi:hypothetical protein
LYIRAQEATLILKKSKEDVVKKIIVNNVSQPTTPIADQRLHYSSFCDHFENIYQLDPKEVVESLESPIP